jgi:exodeoxyribonuclease VII small subunit
MPNKKGTIKESLNKLEEIVGWFDAQDEVDVEAGLDKVKEGAALIKELKARLKKAENEFKEIKKDLENDEEK